MSTPVSTRIALLALAAAMPIACAEETAGPDAPSAQVASYNPGVVTLEWQQRARELVAAARFNALAGGRLYAGLSVAQHAAIEDVDRLLPADLIDPGTGFGPGGRARYEARRGAVAGASARVLGFIFPTAVNTLEQLLADQGSTGPGEVHPEFTRGVAIGRSAGDAMVEHLKTDGFTAPWTGTVPVGPGLWIPTALPPGGGVLPNVKPYFLTSNSQFRPAPPPAFGSAAFN